MNDRVCKGRTVLSVALAAATMLAGCATIRGSEARSTEQLLAAAGFVMRHADTAERQQRLAARPPYRLESHTKDGTVVYTYADPDGCKCLYIGDPPQYQSYQRIAQQQQAQQSEAPGGVEEAREWEEQNAGM